MPTWTFKHSDRRDEEMRKNLDTFSKAESASARRFRERTYVLPGFLGGLAAGGAAGAALGGKGNRLMPALVGAGLGSTAGALTGQYVERPSKKKKEFHTMNPAIKARLVQLNAALDEVVEFRDPREKESSTMGKVAKGAAIGAGVLGATAGGLYLRGSQGIGLKPTGAVGVKDRIIRGKNLLIRRDLPFLGSAADVIAAKSAAGMSAAKSAAQKLKGKMGK
jgi:outer membrane lipoprotein SlyB